MGLHLPKLDGHAATRALRAQEAALAWHRMPIIALTATVLKRDRQARRDSGMDDICAPTLCDGNTSGSAVSVVDPHTSPRVNTTIGVSAVIAENARQAAVNMAYAQCYTRVQVFQVRQIGT